MSNVHTVTISTAYSQENHNLVEWMDIDAGHTDDNTATIAHIPPPREEGCELSHEGGEYEVFEGLVEDIAQATG